MGQALARTIVWTFCGVMALLGGPASAAVPCQAPGITVGWAQTFYGTTHVTGFVYDQAGQILYVSLVGGSFNDFTGVPYGTAQQFTTTSAPDTFFANNVNGRFHEALLTEACGLMLTQAGGVLLTY
jgi:hypothetical protein